MSDRKTKTPLPRTRPSRRAATPTIPRGQPDDFRCLARIAEQDHQHAEECAKIAALPVQHAHAAGIDAGDASHWACVDVTPDGSDTVREFAAHTAGLRQLVAWLQRTRRHGLVKSDWVTADEWYGQKGDFLDALESMQQRYVVEVPVNTTVWTVDPQTQVPAHEGRRGPPATLPPRDRVRQYVRSVRDLAQSLPATAWQVLQLRAGAKGPLAFAFARVRVWAVRHRRPGPSCWLLLRRSLEAEGEVKYYLSNAPAEETLETMALVTGTRYRVEEYFEEGKGYLGMAQYEARAWSSWHHHMSLVALAHLFVTLTRVRLKKNSRADFGYGAAAGDKCPGPTPTERNGGHRHRGVPLEAKPHGLEVTHEIMASTPQKGQIQSAAVKLNDPCGIRQQVAPVRCQGRVAEQRQSIARGASPWSASVQPAIAPEARQKTTGGCLSAAPPGFCVVTCLLVLSPLVCRGPFTCNSAREGFADFEGYSSCARFARSGFAVFHV
jgi:hypothetical protein